jgi:hypothetical protein
VHTAMHMQQLASPLLHHTYTFTTKPSARDYTNIDSLFYKTSIIWNTHTVTGINYLIFIILEWRLEISQSWGPDGHI